MTVKLLCSFAIIAGCGYIGLVVASEYEAGVVQIREFINALKYLETEISINSSVLIEASRRVAEAENGVVSDIFFELSDGMSAAPGERVDEIWMRAVDNNKKRLCLNRETIEIIKEFSVCLGSGTRRMEADNIKAVCQRLKLAEEEAMRKKAKNSKLFKSLGFASGILITVLLL